jgi:hypothetical protein
MTALYPLPFLISTPTEGQYVYIEPSIAQTTPHVEAGSDPAVVWLPEGPIADGWETVKPILLNVERDEDGEYIVTDSFSTVYGNGRTASRAKADYCLSLVEYYEFLASVASTNVEAVIKLAKFSGYVRKKPA